MDISAHQYLLTGPVSAVIQDAMRWHRPLFGPGRSFRGLQAAFKLKNRIFKNSVEFPSNRILSLFNPTHMTARRNVHPCREYVKHALLSHQHFGGLNGRDTHMHGTKLPLPFCFLAEISYMPVSWPLSMGLQAGPEFSGSLDLFYFSLRTNI